MIARSTACNHALKINYKELHRPAPVLKINLSFSGYPQELLLSEPNKCHEIGLPDKYALVKHCSLNVKSVRVSLSDQCTVQRTEEASSPMRLAKQWLLDKPESEILPWPVYNSRAERFRFTCITRTAVLPLFSEHAHDVSMMAHAMDCVTNAINHINPGQTPVITGDQPLYALLRSIQCLQPETYGEDQIFVMMGSLHIEMASLRAVGTLLENSGWVEALVDAKVTTQGRAESMLRGSHVTRTRYVHEVPQFIFIHSQFLHPLCANVLYVSFVNFRSQLLCCTLCSKRLTRFTKKVMTRMILHYFHLKIGTKRNVAQCLNLNTGTL